MAPRRACSLAFLALLAAITPPGCGPAVPEYTLVQSASGGVIKLERKGQVSLGDGSVALSLAYRTDLQVDDPQALRTEVEEVWQTFRSEADEAGVRTALIEARALTGERWSRIGRARRFAFRRDEAGIWRLVERQASRTTAVKPL